MALDEAPPFWWKDPGPLAYSLSPLGYLWGRVSGMRMTRQPASSVAVPVLCVGNFIAGGAGKTPAALAICEAALAKRIRAGFLSRGYGGRVTGPELVDLQKHNAVDVGDEALLLAELAPTVVSTDRAAGAGYLISLGCEFIIMDDGFQNRALAKDYSLVVVDGRRGLGNGMPHPAGPLRADLGTQMLQADAILIVGDGSRGDLVVRKAARRGKPIYRARTVPADDTSDWLNRKVAAFAGIADPEKLFSSLEHAGAEVVEALSYADHHFYSEEECAELLELAREGLQLVTTTKDMVRLQGGGTEAQRLAKTASVFRIETAFDDPAAIDRIIEATTRNFDARQLRERRSETAGQ
jgi:tetraacyldisaccharide 4'-kinase